MKKLILAILLTGSSGAHCLTLDESTPAGSYQITEIAYVISANAVQASCHPGDKLLEGRCDHETRFANFPEARVVISSEKSLVGQSCHVEHMAPDQVVQIKSSVICQKQR